MNKLLFIGNDIIRNIKLRLSAYWQATDLKKDRSIVFVILVYILIAAVFRWRFNLSFDILFFFLGGILGMYFLDFMDYSLKISPSPFKNIFFQTIFVFFTLFVLTSSGSLFGSGLVLSIYLSMIYSQWLQFKKEGNINSWFWIVRKEFPKKTQEIYLIVVSGLFFFLSLMFI